MPDDATIARNLAAVRARLDAAARRAGREPGAVRLIGVTKGRSEADIRALLAAGLADLGENRVQKAKDKIPSIDGASWHLIGHLQRNKARDAVTLFDWIDSVDSVALAEELQKRAAQRDRTVRVLVQVNVAGEEQKNGCPPAEAATVCAAASAGANLELRGLMTIAPFVDDPRQVRWVFADLRRLRDTIREEHGFALPELSMGMTDDFEVAVEEGATMVRVGRALFAEGPVA